MNINLKIKNLLDRIDKLEVMNAELLSQNKELISQNKELTAQNKELIAQNKKLTAQNEKLTAQNEKLTQRVKYLEERLNINSSNSDKPPSSDGLRKPVSLRKSGGKIGGPKGHKGHTLSYSNSPTITNTIKTNSCHNCNQDLEKEPVYKMEKRQVFDIPEIKLEIIEYILEKKKCCNCGTVCGSSFPEGVVARTQYGSKIKALTTYLSVQHHIPLKRIQEIINDLTGHKISEATLIKHQEAIASAATLDVFVQEIKTKLLNSEYIHADETGSRVEGKTKWLHVNSTNECTLYNLSNKRGKIGIEEMEIIPQYEGIVVHDCYNSYFNDEYKIEHALCGAHLLRECQSILDHDGHKWPNKMMALLSHISRLSAKGEVTEHTYNRISKYYSDLIIRAYKEAPYNIGTGKPGKPKQTKAYNLISRLEKHKNAVLLCLKKSAVPFTNNRAEQDIRMVKVKQKVSGSFRTEQGAKTFYKLRGVMSTLNKQGRNIFDSLIEAVKGTLSLSTNQG